MQPLSLEDAAADRLADALNDGAWLRPIHVEGLPLLDGELAYADLEAHGWRFHALDVPYEQRTVMVGGPLLMAVTGLASALGNRRRRIEADRIAAPQWRPLGQLRVVVTSDRLLVWHRGAWWSVWYSAIVDVRGGSGSEWIDLTLDGDHPYRLARSGVTSIGVVLSHLVTCRRM